MDGRQGMAIEIPPFPRKGYPKEDEIGTQWRRFGFFLFSLLLLKMVNGTHLILQKACHFERGYYRMDGEGSEWNVFILSAHILHILFLSLLCLNSVTWIKLHCHYGDETPTWTSGCTKWVVVSQPNVNWTTQSNILPSIHAHSFLVFCKETFVWKRYVTQEILIV